ncbi:DUF1036 domain-containing protein [Chthonobacter albigriseus]|uniref:DUF1036 domain-containing protein n=1 Tax=Chthonobacter albigriseus TaxID=1683161 RepID=UPI003CC7ECC8
MTMQRKVGERRQKTSHRLARHLLTILTGTLVGLGLTTTAALADLRLCNKTDSTVSVALGYKGKEGWRSEGWWNIEGGKCGPLLTGALGSRYYYIYAVDSRRGGEWSGKAFMCTRRKMFTIQGIEDCVARGYERTGFFEIDTAEQRSWTIHLYQPTKEGN